MFSVYRMFDAHRHLLYVGVTSKGADRISQHRRGQVWWPEVATIQVAHYDTLADACAEERRAIQRERPVHNRRHGIRRPRAVRRAPLAAQGQRIRESRRQLGLTQAGLAERLGVTQPAVAQWEKGDTSPNPAVQRLLAEKLGTTRAFLFGEAAA